MDVKGKDFNMKKKFTKREVILFCVCLLEACIIISAIISGISILNEINVYGNIFTFVTAVICSILATALTPRITQDDDSDIVEKMNTEFEDKIKEFVLKQQHVLPLATYVDTDDPNMEFNEKLNESISKTHQYIYYSDRALYLTKRLGKEIHKIDSRLNIIVILADIREDDIFYSRQEIYLQRERARHSNNNSYIIRELDEIICEEKKEILRSLYALGELQKKYNIEIYLHKEIPFIRFEITDSLLVLSFLTQLATGKKYPSTVIYENEAIFKTNFEDYAKEIIKRSYHVQTEDLSVKNLISWGKMSGIDNITEKEIKEYYENVVE